MTEKTEMDDRITRLAARLRSAKLRHLGVREEHFPYDRCPEQEKLEWEAIAREALDAGSNAETPADQARKMTFGYTNWRGEYAIRNAVPLGIEWGSTDWHPEEGWLLRARDTEKGAIRQFALKDCDFTVPD